MDVAKFVEEQKALLKMERDEDVDMVRESLSQLNERELEEAGLLLRRLVLTDTAAALYGRTLVSFAKRSGEPLPSSSFRVRDIVQVVPRGTSLLDSCAQWEEAAAAAAAPSSSASAASTGGAEDTPSGIVYHVREGEITIAVDDFPDHLASSRGGFSLVKLADDVSYQRYTAALDAVASAASAGGNRLVSVMFGHDPPRAHEQPLPWQPFNAALNETQVAAVDMALAAMDVALIHGPPGTGKSTTVIEIVRQCVQRDEKVLVCAPSNIAVDNVVEKLVACGIRACRVGHPARLLPSVLAHSLDSMVRSSDDAKLANDIRSEMSGLLRQMSKARDKSERYDIRGELKALRKELRQREGAAVRSVLDHASVVLCTCTGAASRSLKGMEFDTVVIDECAQALEAACWLPLLMGKRAILAGDHKQLPPTIKSKKAAAQGLQVTLFDRLSKTMGDFMHMLTIQYRMHEAIMRWPSDELYGGKLEAAEPVRAHLLRDLEHVQDTDDTCEPFVFVDSAGCDELRERETDKGESRSNPGEARLVASYVRSMVRSGLQPEEIAVITPYNAQVNEIREHLQEARLGRVEVGTVDGFQGREKELVVISMVRSNTTRSVGFLVEDRRTNVAITRARRQVAVFGDSSTISAHPFLSRLVDYAVNHTDYRSARAEYFGDAETDAGAAGGSGEPLRDPAEHEALLNLGGMSLADLRKQKEQHIDAGDSEDDGAANESAWQASMRRKEARRLEKQRQRDAWQAEKERLRQERESKELASQEQQERGKKKKQKEEEMGDGAEQPQDSPDDYSDEKFVQGILNGLVQAWKVECTATTEYRFPSSINSFQRMQIHTICERSGEGLVHKSVGLAKDRQVVIRPPESWYNPSASVHGGDADAGGDAGDGSDGDDLRDIIGVKFGDNNKKGKRIVDKKKAKKSEGSTLAASAFLQRQAQKAMQAATAAAANVPSSHPSGGEMKTKSKKKKKSKSKSNVQKQKGGRGGDGADDGDDNDDRDDDDDDFDAILAEFKGGSSVCGHAACKKKVNDYTGLICPHCHLLYCVAHQSHIFHSTACQAAARAAHQEQLRARMTGSGPKLKPDKRKTLQFMLHKNIQAKADQRTGASSSDKDKSGKSSKGKSKKNKSKA